MSSNKKSIARGLGASALAVATVASGLSFGAVGASAAAPAQTKLEASIGQIDVAFDTGSAYYIPGDALQTDLGSSSWNIGIVRGGEAVRSLAEVAAKSKYSVLPSSDGSGRFALQKGTRCLVNPAYPTTWTARSQGYTVEVRSSAPSGQVLATVNRNCGVSDALFSYEQGTLRFARSVVGVGNRTHIGGWQSTCQCNDSNIRFGANGIITSGASSTGLVGDIGAILPFSAEWAFQDGRDERSVISGKGQPNADIIVKDAAGAEVAAAEADADGQYSVEIDAPNKGGEYAVTVEQTDEAGAKLERKVTLDYGSAVDIESPRDQDLVDDSPIVVEGKGEPGSEVTVSVNGASSAVAKVNDNGSWNRAVNLRDGENTITATQKSKGANTTVASATVNPGESSVAPLVIETPADGSSVDTDSKRVQFSGTAEPGARVQVLTQTATPRTIIDTYANAEGAWSQLGGDLNFGVAYTLDTVYTPQGESAVRGTHRVTLNEANPGVEQPFAFTTPRNNTEVVAPNKQVRLAGEGATGTKVTIWNYRTKDRVVGTATVGKDGTWEIPAAEFNNQNNRYELHVEYVLAGQTAPTVLTHNITVKAEEGVERPFDVTTPAEGSTVIAPDKQVAFSGTGTTGTKVEIFNHVSKGRVVASAVVNDKGEWATTGELNNENTPYALHVEYTTPGQNVQTLTRNITVKAEASTDLPYVVGTPAEGSNVTLENYRATDNNGETTISGTGKTGGMVKVWNYESKNRIVIKGGEILTVDENGEWSGVGELAGNMEYKLHIEYFEPSADLDGEPTSVVTRSFNTVAPTK